MKNYYKIIGNLSKSKDLTDLMEAKVMIRLMRQHGLLTSEEHETVLDFINQKYHDIEKVPGVITISQNIWGYDAPLVRKML